MAEWKYSKEMLQRNSGGRGIEEQNREEGEMAQKKLGGGRNRGGVGRSDKM